MIIFLNRQSATDPDNFNSYSSELTKWNSERRFRRIGGCKILKNNDMYSETSRIIKLAGNSKLQGAYFLEPT